MDLNLPEALIQITSTHERGATQGVEDVRDVREGVDVPRDPGVNLTEIVAIAYVRLNTVRELRNLCHGRGPWSRARLDDGQLEHGSHTLALSLQPLGRQAPRWTVVRLYPGQVHTNFEIPYPGIIFHIKQVCPLADEGLRGHQLSR